jgi:hypothetical protein
MLKNIELSREVAKAEYKRLKGDADLKLAALQRQVKALASLSLLFSKAGARPARAR